MDEADVAVYGCEVKLQRVGIIRYIIKYDFTQHIFVLYPDNEYLKVSTTLLIDHELLFSKVSAK